MEIVQLVFLTGAAAAVAAFASRLVVVPKQTSPTPQRFDVELTDAYKRIFKLLSKEEVGAHHWKIVDSMENQYINANLTYSEAKLPQLLTVNGVVKFDFKKIAEHQTQVRWFCKWDPLSDIVIGEKVEKLTDSWIRTALTESGFSMELITLLSEFDTQLDQESAYDRLMQRLTSGIDRTTKWSVNEFKSPSTISAQVEHIDLYRRLVTCGAKIDFALTNDGKQTKVHCTYHFEPKYPTQTIEPFKQLTDDWINLVLSTS